MKRASLAALQRDQPQVRAVRTWNASQQRADAVSQPGDGFVVTGYTHEWQKQLG